MLAGRQTRSGFHALRHTAASWMVQDGVPLYEVARILGHGSIYVTSRYAHLVPGFAERGIDSLGSRLRPDDMPPMKDADASIEEPKPEAKALQKRRRLGM